MNHPTAPKTFNHKITKSNQIQILNRGFNNHEIDKNQKYFFHLIKPC